MDQATGSEIATKTTFMSVADYPDLGREPDPIAKEASPVEYKSHI